MTTSVVGRHLVAAVRAVALAGLALGSALSLALHALLFLPGFGLGMVFLLPYPMAAARPLPNLARRLATRWSGVAVARPYRPRPAPPSPGPDGRYQHGNQLYRRPAGPALLARLDWVLGDIATHRDLAWLLLNPVIGGLLAGSAPALIAAGGWLAVSRAGQDWWAVPAGAAGVLTGLAVAPALVRLHGRWTRLLLRAPVPRAGMAGFKSWLTGRLLAMLRLLCLLGLTLLAVPMAALTVLGIVLGYGLGLVVVLPPLIEHFRWLANLRRQLAGAWSGVDVPAPYLPRPDLPEPRPDGLYQVGRHLYRTSRWTRYNQRLRWLTHDPATWRETLWLVADPVVGGLLLLIPPVLTWYGYFGLVLPRLWHLLGARETTGWQVALTGVDAPALPIGGAVPVGLGLVAGGFATMAAGLALAPVVLRWHGRWTRLLLAPTERARLAQRVRQLAESRAAATEAQASELRRIERDLHDGAQARLVALGLTLGNIEHLLDRDPAAARELLAQARDGSVRALAELRDLVRGIHPPVLAERGLGDAVRALALDLPVPVDVAADLPGRLPEPIETAAYFGVSELLANAAKHARANRVSVDIRHTDGRLRITVRDDGRGGADPAAGSGLRGVRRRLGTFDGAVVVASPAGGPTSVTLEIPCASSSPKTSTC
jgi:signal transduction histidine kinase